MTAQSQLERLDREVMNFLESYPGEWPYYRDFVIDLWKHHLALGLPKKTFVKEITGGIRERFFQCLWEMLLARHLHAQGHDLTSPIHGPDFRFKYEGRVIWVEAISPEPRGLPDHWLEGPKLNAPSRVEDVPHEQIGLRWTAAFKEKWEKFKEYRQKGIVSDDDAYVIAIHGGQLGMFPLDHGISRYPLALETVFPIGPLAIPIDVETRKLGKPVTSERFFIRKANGSPVPTTPFIDRNYAGISAVLGYSGGAGCSGPSLPAHVVHNPFATVSVPFGILGKAAEEWSAEPSTDGLEMELRKRCTVA